MTGRQRAILFFIHDCLAETGISPSVSEIAGWLGIARVNASRHIQLLVRDGYLSRMQGVPGARSLQVVRLPGTTLRAQEIAWCHANPERVRALIALAGQGVASPPAVPVVPLHPRAAMYAAVDAGRRAIERLAPGETAEIDLPAYKLDRQEAYTRISRMASEAWGTRGAVRRSTRAGMQLERTVGA